MADTCHICGGLSEDDCVNCHRPTCSVHGRYTGDYFLCVECIAEADEDR